MQEEYRKSPESPECPGSGWGQSVTRSRLRHSAQLVQLPTRHCIGASGVVMGNTRSVRRPGRVFFR